MRTLRHPLAMLALLAGAVACSAPGLDDSAAAPAAPVRALGLTPSKTTSGHYRVWPDGRVPYAIAPSVGQTTETRLLKAMDQWQTKSEQRVRFEPKTAADKAYLHVVGSSSPQTSRVGYKAGAITEMELRNPEYITVIRHELGHVLGLHHEQKRQDRGQHIQVKSANIVDSALCKSQFAVCADCEMLDDYNIGSVMHYRTTDLKSCRTGPVLLHKDGSAIDHEWVLTSGDLLAIADLYGPPPDGAGGVGGGGGGAGGEEAGLGGGGGDDSLDIGDEPGGSGGAAGGAAAEAEPVAEPEAAGSCAFPAPPAGGTAAIPALALAAAAVARRRRQFARGTKRGTL